MGQGLDNLCNTVYVTLLLSNELSILAIVLEELVIVSISALKFVFQKIAIDISEAKQVLRGS